jgi:hypothetical protein
VCNNTSTVTHAEPSKEQASALPRIQMSYLAFDDGQQILYLAVHTVLHTHSGVFTVASAEAAVKESIDISIALLAFFLALCVK